MQQQHTHVASREQLHRQDSLLHPKIISHFVQHANSQCIPLCNILQVSCHVRQPPLASIFPSTIPKLSRKAIGDGSLSSACPISHDEYDMGFQLCLAKPYPRQQLQIFKIRVGKVNACFVRQQFKGFNSRDLSYSRRSHNAVEAPLRNSQVKMAIL